MAGEQSLGVSGVARSGAEAVVEVVAHLIKLPALFLAEGIQFMQLAPQFAIEFVAGAHVFGNLQPAIQQTALAQQCTGCGELRVACHEGLQAALVAGDHALPQADDGNKDGEFVIAQRQFFGD